MAETATTTTVNETTTTTTASKASKASKATKASSEPKPFDALASGKADALKNHAAHKKEQPET